MSCVHRLRPYLQNRQQGAADIIIILAIIIITITITIVIVSIRPAVGYQRLDGNCAKVNSRCFDVVQIETVI